MKIGNLKHSFLKKAITCIVLCSISVISLSAKTDTLTILSGYNNLRPVSEARTSLNDDIITSNANHLSLFSSQEHTLAPSAQSSSFGFDDDFGDEEIGVIPICDGTWFLLLLSFGYILFTLRKHN